MKRFLVSSVLVLTFVFSEAGLFAQTKEEELFSTKGAMVRVNEQAKTFHLKGEGGLELTFQTEEATQIKAGEEIRSFTDLAVGDLVEVDYHYNEHYKKIAESIRKQLKKEIAKS